VAAHYPTFNLRLSNPGVFPSSSRARILWLGVDDASNITSSLYKELDAVCGGLGFKSDPRKYQPHITIGRIREPGKARELVNEHLEKQIEPVEFKVAEIVLYQSDLQPAGSVYSVVARAMLRSAS